MKEKDHQSKYKDIQRLKHIQAGGREGQIAWNSIFEDYYVRLEKSFQVNFKTTPEEFEDAFGGTITSIVNTVSKETFSLDSSLYNYLYQAIRRQLVRNRKKQGRIAETEECLSIQKSHDPERILIKKEELRQIDDMEEPCKTLLTMKIMGFSYEEIANEINLAVSTLKKKYRECKENLRDRM